MSRTFAHSPAVEEAQKRYPQADRQLLMEFACKNTLDRKTMRALKKKAQSGQLDDMTGTAIIYVIHRNSRFFQ